MKAFKIITLLVISPLLLSECPDVLDHDMRVLDSKEKKNLCEYKGKVVLAVNVASRCGFVYQYEELQNLFKKYENNDFVVLGFPSRDFLYQEYSDESKVKEFCNTEYGVTFPMFATSAVKGNKANNFYKDLSKYSGESPGWNFHKYLIDKEGKVRSFSTKIEPDSQELISAIDSIL
ncbi:MAG: glutathione peroxidase [Gammaproteobacteria bacterium]